MNKIAIIEDDIDICNMIAKFLENNKYIVHYALNGAEGIELCKSLNHLLSYQLSHTRKTITIPLIIWTSDTFRRKFLFFFLRWFTTCSIGTSVVMSPEESTMHTIF